MRESRKLQAVQREFLLYLDSRKEQIVFQNVHCPAGFDAREASRFHLRFTPSNVERALRRMLLFLPLPTSSPSPSNIHIFDTTHWAYQAHLIP